MKQTHLVRIYMSEDKNIYPLKTRTYILSCKDFRSYIFPEKNPPMLGGFSRAAPRRAATYNHNLKTLKHIDQRMLEVACYHHLNFQDPS